MRRSLELSKMNVRVGVMSLAGFAILVWALFFPVRGVSLWGRKLTLVGYFNRVDGLKRNAPVYFRGTEVGTVESVAILPQRVQAPLKVVISVQRDIRPLLPADTRMDIVAMGLLGDVFIELKADPLRLHGGPMLADGQVLPTRPYDSVLAGMNSLSGQVRTLLVQVNAIAAKIRSGRGTVGRMVNDDRLYDELLAAVTELKTATARIDALQTSFNTKLLDPNTKKAVDQTVATAQRLIDNADELTAKAQALRWHLGLGMDKYAGQLYGATASLRIIPSPNRYYEGGVSYFNQSLPFTAHDNSLGEGFIGYNAVLAWRVLGSPVFFRGGIKRSSPDLGLDYRIGEVLPWLPVEVDFDAYHFSNPVPQVDLGLAYNFAQAFNITMGVENFGYIPQFRAGLQLIYDDEDLTTMLIKARTGL